MAKFTLNGPSLKLIISDVPHRIKTIESHGLWKPAWKLRSPLGLTIIFELKPGIGFADRRDSKNEPCVGLNFGIFFTKIDPEWD